MRRFWAIFKKEFRQIRRDRLSLGLLIFVPALLLTMYGYALSFDVKHIGMAVLDEDNTPESRRLLDNLFQNPYFDRNYNLTSRAQADGLLARGKVRGVLIVPIDYSKKLSRGEVARIQVLVDGADATSATTTVGYLDALTDGMTRQLRLEAFDRAGMKPIMPMITPEPRIWFNPQMESAHFLVPGLIGMLLMLSAVIATSLSIVREKERETMEQIMVSRIRAHELILGKIIPYVFICLATIALVLAMGYFLFGVVIKGSFWLLTLSTLLFLFAALSMGLFISSITRSQQVAFQIATLTSLLPSIVLSGLVFPIQSMPKAVQLVTLLVIPRYFVAVLRGIILKAAPFSAIWPNLLGMLILGFFFIWLAARNTRKSV